MHPTYNSQVTLVALAPEDAVSSATSAIVTFQSSQQEGYGNQMTAI